MYSLIHNHQVSKLPAFLLLVFTFGFLAPLIAQAQKVPTASGPALAGIWCPSCKGYIPCPSGKRPSKCPHCPYSFVQGTKPRPAPVRPLKPLPGPGNTQRQPVPDQQNGQPYYDGNGTGGLPSSTDPTGLADTLAKIWALDRQKQDEQNQAFERKKQALLGSTASQPLRNPFADGDPVDLRHLKDGRGVVGSLKGFDPPERSSEKMKTTPPPRLSPQSPDVSNLSDEQLENMRQAYIRQLKGTQKYAEYITARHNEDEVMIQENKNQAKSDTKDVISSLPGEKVFGKDIPDIPIEFAEDSSPKPKPSLFEEVISTAIEVLETPLPDGNPLEGPLKITAQTLRTGLIAGHAANATAADVYVISNQKELGSQLEQNEQNRKIAFENLKVIVEEQNRRKSPSTAETKPNADSVRTFTHSEVELQPIELTIDPKWIIPSVPKTP